jgi:hypothetical protein
MKFEYSKCFCDFSLIILIFIFLTYPAEMEHFSHSILGKLCAVILIAYYTTQNLMYGLLFCIVVIYYYQVKQFAMDTKKTTEGFTSVDLVRGGQIHELCSTGPLSSQGTKTSLRFFRNTAIWAGN